MNQAIPKETAVLSGLSLLLGLKPSAITV